VSKKSPSNYERIEVANATLDAAEDRIEELTKSLCLERERADRAEEALQASASEPGMGAALEISRLQSELADEKKRADALVAALPKCDKCDEPATRSPGRGRERRCDKHAHISRVPGESFYCRDEYPRAEPIRAIQRARAAEGK
jgi:hypothetical protein